MLSGNAATNCFFLTHIDTHFSQVCKTRHEFQEFHKEFQRNSMSFRMLNYDRSANLLSSHRVSEHATHCGPRKCRSPYIQIAMRIPNCASIGQEKLAWAFKFVVNHDFRSEKHNHETAPTFIIKVLQPCRLGISKMI